MKIISKQTGVIKLKGTLAGITFYHSRGQDYAKQSGGPSKERIAKDPAFARTRENNKEFSGISLLSKSFRTTFMLSTQDKCDNSMGQRASGILREMLYKNTGIRGQRSIQLSANKTMFEGFAFDAGKEFSQKFLAPFTLTPNAGRNQCDIVVPNFLPASCINAPCGATYFRLVATLGVVSDFVYNASTFRYEPSDIALNQLSNTVYSATTSLTAKNPVSFTLSTVLPGTPAPVLTATSSVILCLGIEFFQRIGTIDYIFNSENCMKVIKVF